MDSDSTPQADTPTPTEYEDRLLIYLDVLGWSKLIKGSIDKREDRETLAAIAERLRTPVAAMELSLEKGEDFFGIRVSQFSDTLVLSCPLGDRRLVFALCVMAIATAQVVVARGYYLRGAVVEGKLIHRPDVIYGPALVAAYEVERDVAEYPRIVVTPGAEETLRRAKRKFSWSLLCRDRDGLMYLNVLTPSHVGPEDRRRFRADIEQRQVRDANDLGLLSKHHWMLSYLDEIEREAQEGRSNSEKTPAPSRTAPKRHP